jgi:LEA14-like dessication related protein
MKNAIPFILAAAGIYFAVRLFRKAQTVAILNIKIRTLKLQPISQAAVVVEVINPTNTSINFTSITGDLLVNNVAISTINYQTPTVIPANSSKTLNLRIKINPVQLASFTANRIFSKTKISNIKFVANISGEGLNIPVTIEQQISI